MSKTVIKPSKYQSAIYREIKKGSGNLVVNACAGSGKTTTILEALKLVPKEQSQIFLAFNKSIVEELKDRVPDSLKSCVRTMHSFGWGKVQGAFYTNRPKLNQYKLNNIAKVYLEDYLRDLEYASKQSYIMNIVQLANLARLTLSLKPGELELIADEHNIPITNGEIEHALNLIDIANEDKNEFDFTDMIYQPYKLGLIKPEFDYVWVDECQDLNAAQQHMIRSMVKPDGRIIGVGDKRQAIYGFSGSDYESFNRLLEMQNTKELPLSVSYRCPKNIVKLAQRIVPEIEFHEDAEDGEVLYVKNLDPDSVSQGDFILCRVNAPLVGMYFKLIRSGKKAAIRGRDIAKSLITIVKKTKADTITELFDGLDDYKSREILRLSKTRRGNSLDNAIQMLQDKIDTLGIIATKYDSVDAMVAGIEEMFSDERGEWIYLMSCHKSKGLEADNVYIIEPSKMPHPMAKGQKQLDQEYNLMYVAYTRAKKKLVFVTGSDMEQE